MYVNCYFFSGSWQYSLYNFGFSFHLCRSFFDRPNGESCVLSIVNFSIFVRAIFRYMFGFLTLHFFEILSDATQSFTAIFFSDFSCRFIFVFFADCRWMLWHMCNLKLLIIFIVCSCRLFQNGVGHLTIITSKFCGISPVNFLDVVPCILLTNISIFVGPSQWFLFFLCRAVLRGWIITTFCYVAHGEFFQYYV